MSALRLMLRLPDPVLRMIAGRSVAVDGRRPALTAQVLIRVSRFAPFDAPHQNGPLERARAEMNQAGMLAGAGIYRSVVTTDRTFPGPGGPIRLRLYEPAGLAA